MRSVLLTIALAGTCLLAPASKALAIDPHALFEERCSRCHGPHGGDFARASLVVAPDGTLTGIKKGAPITDYLASHFGNPSAPEIAALVDMFTRQVASKGLFGRNCRVCHTDAKRLARTKLVLRDGKLIGRFTARDMSDFLAFHGRLTGGDVETMHEMLEWQLRTAADRKP